MEANKLNRVLVIGAGVMGHSIAQVYAQAGIGVDLVDINQDLLDYALKKIEFDLEILSEFDRVSTSEIPTILKRINPSTELKPLAENADFVVEVINEDRQVKKELFSKLEEFCPETAILASNTSELNIFHIAKIKNPERLIIQHWFHPPHIIPLVEIVAGKKTSKDVVDFSVNLMKRIGKKPIVLKKFTNAFIVNKIQQAINSAVFNLLARGITTPRDIDDAIKNTLGIRLPIVGLVQNMDFVGLDVISDVLKNMGLEMSIIKENVEKGHFGAKTSKGIYDYGARSELEILKKRDRQYLKMLDYLEKNDAFEPI